MKAIALLVLVLIAAPASAQKNHIAVYADIEARNGCPLDISEGPFEVYVILTGGRDMGAAQFAVVTGGGFEGVYLGESLPGGRGIKVGISHTGVSIALGDCLSPPVHLLTLYYYGYGISAACSYFDVTPHPDVGAAVHTDCAHDILLASVGRTYINANDNCFCASSVIVPTEVSTWGHIKAVYGGR